MTVILAMILDALLGEPAWLWSRLRHPAVLMGQLISYADDRFNTGERQRNGAAVMIALGCGALALGWALASLGPVVEIIIGAVLLAQRSLVDHVRTVGDALRLSLGDGRLMVARIVGRDTQAMDRPAVARAAIESGAENFSDGVIAPLFWFALLGLPGLLLYKITNTADSMIGYRTEKYEDFGKAAARFDDLLNLIPARLTAVLIALSFGVWRQWPAIVRDARQHRSPNAGWPEAALAYALDISLSGPRAYQGESRDFPYVNAGGRDQIGADEIEHAVQALWRVWAVVLAGLTFGLFLCLLF